MRRALRRAVLAVAAVCLTSAARAPDVPPDRLPYNEVYAPPELAAPRPESAALDRPAAAGRRLLLVSTLDGRLSALDPAGGGTLLWSLQAQDAGMLSSTLTQNLQLSQQGQWVRLIPSLDGQLFSYDGDQVEPLPVTADTLLQSSYRFADDTVIMGGSQVATLGIDLESGQLRYRCGAGGCVRPVGTAATDDGGSDNDDGDDDDDRRRDVLVLRQHTQTVRAVEPRSGQERWNFSVSRHELALSAGALSAAATPPAADSLLTAELAEGRLSGVERGRRWQHRFAQPLVHVWRLDGSRLQEVDLLAPASGEGQAGAVRPLLYLGVHEKQLYIQQSLATAVGGPRQLAVAPAARGQPQVKWRPYIVSASSRTPVIHGTTSRSQNPLLLSEAGGTALALRPEEYPYEGGYYLYSSDCLLETGDSHGPFVNPQLPPGDGDAARLDDGDLDDGVVYVMITSLSFWWPQILLLSASIAVLLNLLVTEHYRLYYRAQAYRLVRTVLRLQPPRYVVRQVAVPVREEVIREVEVVREVVREAPPAEQPPPRSRFLEDFEPVQCLGRGGFGVVFEAKNRLDGHSYAVKRIRLPGRERARRRVLREVSCLAKLEHRNIVRYFYCWTEKLSADCLREQDTVLESSEWLSSRTPLNSLETGAASAPGSPQPEPELSASVVRLTQFASAVPGGGGQDWRLRTIGGGFLPTVAGAPPAESSRSARSANDGIVFSAASRETSGTFSVQDSGELADASGAGGRTAGDGRLSELSEDDDGVVFATESGGPVVDYTLPDPDGDGSASAASRSGPMVAFQKSPSAFAGGSGFWDDDEVTDEADSGPDGAPLYLFIQMQLCRKESLKDWLNANCWPRQPPQVLSIFWEILNGVEYVHSQRLMHRDLKPSNIFFSPDGTVKIGDFGLATTLGGDPIGPAPSASSGDGWHTDQVGTQLYMSPEQVLGHAYDDKVDIYSLGIILFELLVPFGTQMERQRTLTLVRRLVFPDPFQQQRPREHALLAKMLCHQPQRRPTIAEIRCSVSRGAADPLEGLTADQPDSGRPGPPAPDSAEPFLPAVDSPTAASSGTDSASLRSAAEPESVEWNAAGLGPLRSTAPESAALDSGRLDSPKAVPPSAVPDSGRADSVRMSFVVPDSVGPDSDSDSE